jgi:hypothetical protein
MAIINRLSSREKPFTAFFRPIRVDKSKWTSETDIQFSLSISCYYAGKSKNRSVRSPATTPFAAASNAERFSRMIWIAGIIAISALFMRYARAVKDFDKPDIVAYYNHASPAR